MEAIIGTALLIIAIIAIIGLLVCGVMLSRNNLVFRYRMKRIEHVSTLAKEAIRKGEPWEPYHTNDDALTYDKMMWSLHKWKYEDFYPNPPSNNVDVVL